MGQFQKNFSYLMYNGFKKVDRNTKYSSTSIEWKFLSNDYAETNYGINLVYAEKDTTLAGMCFSDII